MATALAGRVQSVRNSNFFRSSFSLFRNLSSAPSSASSSDSQNPSTSKKSKRRKKKNLFEVAQFLPNWGIGYRMAKTHWTDVSYEITKINLYKVFLSLWMHSYPANALLRWFVGKRTYILFVYHFCRMAGMARHGELFIRMVSLKIPITVVYLFILCRTVVWIFLFYPFFLPYYHFGWSFILRKVLMLSTWLKIVFIVSRSAIVEGSEYQAAVDSSFFNGILGQEFLSDGGIASLPISLGLLYQLDDKCIFS